MEFHQLDEIIIGWNHRLVGRRKLDIDVQSDTNHFDWNIDWTELELSDSIGWNHRMDEDVIVGWNHRLTGIIVGQDETDWIINWLEPLSDEYCDQEHIVLQITDF